MLSWSLAITKELRSFQTLIKNKQITTTDPTGLQFIELNVNYKVGLCAIGAPALGKESLLEASWETFAGLLSFYSACRNAR